ncbi:MAG: prolyl oligopeptidase family serine peptidase [Candidatus Heimdallarchaeota archaeon]|nr:prolyl oligopeptidase family serine peptidase [Candidatus Heimdallarchaeota archaeon]
MTTKNFLDQLMTIPKIYRVKISPKGNQLIFSWKNIHSNVDVFYLDLNANNGPFALTKTPEATMAVAFYPKSNAVLVGEDKNRNERVRLFRVNIDEPKKMIGLTEDNPSFFLRGGQVHPNEKWLIYGANYDPQKKKEIEPTWIYRQNLETNERIILAKPEKPAWFSPSLNKIGDYLIYSRKELHPRGEQIWLVTSDGNEDREILNFGRKARVYACWLPDSKRVAFITDTKNGEFQNYYSLGFYSIETEEVQWIIDDSERNVEDFAVPLNGAYVVVIEYQKARPQSSIINLESMDEWFVPRIKGNLQPLFPSRGDEWIGSYYSSTQPDELVKFNIKNPKPEMFSPLTKVWTRTSLVKEDLTEARDFDWQGKDGLPLHGWLYQPKQPSGKTIVYVHGGPTAHSEDEINVELQYFVHQGFTVFDPNYRGSTGYGVEFEESIKEKGWGGDEQNDILAGIEALIEKKLAKPKKIGITGTSYGGYSSWFAITHAPLEVIAAAAPICGMTDLIVDYETTRPDLRPYSEEMLGGNPEEVPEKYYERSPINFVADIKGKLLVIQGAQDPNVTPKNVEEVKRKLDDNGINYEVLIFDDEGHGILKTKNQKVLFKKLADFFEQALE